MLGGPAAQGRTPSAQPDGQGAYAGALPNAQVLDIASGTPRALARLELLGCSD